jgi:large subunit ribosomal protein L29
MSVGTRATELRELPDDELVERLREAKVELFNLRVQSATGQLDSHGRLKVIRRDIARIYTVMRERELGLSAAPDDVAAEAVAEEVAEEVAS